MCLWIKNNTIVNAFGMIRRSVSFSVFRAVDRKEINRPIFLF